ncbi:C40 family peptidase [Alicyclobacillus acidiphilus]|uniref:C40 family peptidase n=1 Tax=Alicyclobacillus acidiphilus TaxID=182455 RepID=UPI00082B490D|nr:C40 family peptidase [Alicyclobacillus acidiphilus]
MRHPVKKTLLACVMILPAIAMDGCAPQHPESQNAAIANGTGAFASMVSAGPTLRGPVRMVAVLDAKRLPSGTVQLTTESQKDSAVGENVVDLASPDGVSNFVASRFPNAVIHEVDVMDESGRAILKMWPSSVNQVSTSVNASGTTFALGHTLAVPPPGVVLDGQVTPRAGKNATESDKTDAVLNVAAEQLGAPFVWGHTKDRGQRGFDAGNFVAYVYRHALGYDMSGNTNAQWDTVGVSVPTWDLRPGDLLFFDNGAHVGIYCGDDEMYQCGGGTGKVSKISIGPDSDWGKRLDSVRRMY